MCNVYVCWALLKTSLLADAVSHYMNYELTADDEVVYTTTGGRIVKWNTVIVGLTPAEALNT